MLHKDVVRVMSQELVEEKIDTVILEHPEIYQIYEGVVKSVKKANI